MEANMSHTVHETITSSVVPRETRKSISANAFVVSLTAASREWGLLSLSVYWLLRSHKSCRIEFPSLGCFLFDIPNESHDREDVDAFGTIMFPTLFHDIYQFTFHETTCTEPWIDIWTFPLYYPFLYHKETSWKREKATLELRFVWRTKKLTVRNRKCFSLLTRTCFSWRLIRILRSTCSCVV